MAPKSYRTRFIEPGIISYDDQDAGTVLVSRETLDRMAPSFKGCPVIFVPEKHNDSDKETAFDFEDVGANPPSGIVSGSPEWGDDGWQYVDLLVWDENAQQVIDKGFSVSCAYMTDDVGPGGKWHELEYDEEITNGHYMHMAIVERPRYEGSRIFANSAKGGVKVSIFKPKQNAAPPIPPKAEEHKEPDGDEKKPGQMMVNDDTTLDVNGTPVPLHELIAKYIESKGGEPEAESLQDTDMVSLPDGSQVSVGDLKAAYGSGAEAPPEGAMPNAEPVQDEKAVSPIAVTRQNAAPAPKPVAPRVVNQALKNAAARPGDVEIEGFETEKQRLDRGKARYSRSVPQEAK